MRTNSWKSLVHRGAREKTMILANNPEKPTDLTLIKQTLFINIVRK